MKSFLLQVLSIKWKILQSFKQKTKENGDYVPNRTARLQPLPLLADRTFDYLFTNNHQKVLPLNQSIVQVVLPSSAKRNNTSRRSSCCQRKNKISHQNDPLYQQQLLPWIRERNPYTNTNKKNRSRKQKSLKTLGIAAHAIRDDRQSDSSYQTDRTRTTTVQQDSSSDPMSSAKEKQELSISPRDVGPDTKQLYNEMNIRELVNTVRREIGALVDADRNNQNEQSAFSDNKGQSINHNFSKDITLDSDNRNINFSAANERKKKQVGKRKIKRKEVKTRKTPKSGKRKTGKRKKKKKRVQKTRQKSQKNKRKPLKPADSNASITESYLRQIPTEHSNNCCCNFLHYSLRQVMRDSEQMKQFALNTSMIGLDPLKLKDSTNTRCPAICIPMYNCENIRDQRFPNGPTFTTISKNELNQSSDHSNENKINPMIIQTINTLRGRIQIKLDPQSFGLAPFFSDQYETFIKGPPSSIFFTSYLNTYHK